MWSNSIAIFFLFLSIMQVYEFFPSANGTSIVSYKKKIILFSLISSSLVFVRRVCSSKMRGGKNVSRDGNIICSLFTYFCAYCILVIFHIAAWRKLNYITHSLIYLFLVNNRNYFLFFYSNCFRVLQMSIVYMYLEK